MGKFLIFGRGKENTSIIPFVFDQSFYYMENLGLVFTNASRIITQQKVITLRFPMRKRKKKGLNDKVCL